LTELVQLGIAIEHSSTDELIEYSEYNRRQDREDDVVEGESPTFFENLTRERILERELMEYETRFVSSVGFAIEEEELTQKPVM
jgi:hypothetical protein